MIEGDACFSLGLKLQTAKLAVINNIAAVAYQPMVVTAVSA